MNTLSPKIKKKFSPAFDVVEYQEALKKYNYIETGALVHNRKQEEAKKEYWNKLPESILAKCPICGAEHTDWPDLHTTAQSGGAQADPPQLLFYRESRYRGCKHLVRMASFINLNNNKPQRRLYIESEVPYVTDCMFPANIQESYAVINAFPLCRIEEDKFVPAYTLYILAYYGEDPNKLSKLKIPDWEGLFRPVLYSIDEAWENRDKKIFDLKYWVRQGRLFWVDEEDGETILRNNPETFPYVNIEGRVEKMLYENGEGKVVGHNKTPRYFPTWKPEDWPKEKEPKKTKNLFFPILLVLAILTTLFAKSLNPAWIWAIIFISIGITIYKIVKTSYQPYERGEVSFQYFARTTVLALFGLLFTLGIVIFISKWTVLNLGVLVLTITNIDWLSAVIGLLGTFIIGFGTGKLATYIWKKLTKNLQ